MRWIGPTPLLTGRSTMFVFSSLLPFCRIHPLPPFSLNLCTFVRPSGFLGQKSLRNIDQYSLKDTKGSWDVPAPPSHSPIKPKRIKNKELATNLFLTIFFNVFVYLKVTQFTSEEFGHRCMISVCETVSCIYFQKNTKNFILLIFIVCFRLKDSNSKKGIDDISICPSSRCMNDSYFNDKVYKS